MKYIVFEPVHNLIFELKIIRKMKKSVYTAVAALALFSLTSCADIKRIVSSPSSSVEETQPIHETTIAQAPQPTDTYDLYKDTSSYGQGIEEVNTMVMPGFSQEYVDERIMAYGKKLERWKELDEQTIGQEVSQKDTQLMVRCFRGIQQVLNGYTTLRAALLSDTGFAGVDPQSINEVQQADISFLDGECGILLAEFYGGDGELGPGSELQGLAGIETLIAEYSDRRDYENVIQKWSEVPADQRSRLSLETQILYGKALTYLHQEDQAIKLYESIIDSMRFSEGTDLLSLHKRVADLHTASGDYIAAEKQYKLIDKEYKELAMLNDWAALQLSILARSGSNGAELTAYSSLLRDYLGFLPGQDGYKVVWEAEKFLEDYPYSPVSSNVDAIKKDAMQVADEWFESLWATVDELSGENRFEDAVAFLQIIPLDLIGPEKATTVHGKIEALLLADAVDRETQKMSEIQDLQKQWNNGMLLVRADEHDKALDVFNGLLGTEYDDKATAKIREVSLKAAQSKRRKAADAFIRYTKTADVESQKLLLIESRKILRDILINYPDVEIEDKVRRNIDRVEQEMNKIDPQLLPLVRVQEMGGGMKKDETSADVFEQSFENQMEPSGMTTPLPIEQIQ